MQLIHVSSNGKEKGAEVAFGIDEQDFANLIRGMRVFVAVPATGLTFELVLDPKLTYDRMFIQLERFMRDIYPEKAEL